MNLASLQRQATYWRYASGACSGLGAAGLTLDVVCQILNNPAAQHNPALYCQAAAYAIWGISSPSIIFNARRGNSKGFKTVAKGYLVAACLLLAGDPTKLQDVFKAVTALSLIGTNILQSRAKVLQNENTDAHHSENKEPNFLLKNALIISGVVKAAVSGPSFMMSAIATHRKGVVFCAGLIACHWMTQMGVGVIENRIRKYSVPII